ncbi:MAG TPA: HAD family phosphatase [Candidatus Dormibacteraeota bacterium]|nr:HAD family phosphatase [Candidatus Dormibacteraeota bacterium]
MRDLTLPIELMTAHATPSVAVFDLGGVLVDWDPRHLYRRLFDDPEEMEAFLEEVALAEWNAQQDAGRPFAEAVEILSARYPHRRELIEAFRSRWPETLGGEIDGSVEILAELGDRGVRRYALSNWSAETFPVALERFEWLRWFDGVLISGEVGVIKPDPRIFRRLAERFTIDPAQAVFIDDSIANVEAAARFGFHSIAFRDPASLRAELAQLGLLSRGAT